MIPHKIHIKYKYCNNLFMHKDQDQINIVEVNIIENELLVD